MQEAEAEKPKESNSTASLKRKRSASTGDANKSPIKRRKKMYIFDYVAFILAILTTRGPWNESEEDRLKRVAFWKAELSPAAFKVSPHS